MLLSMQFWQVYLRLGKLKQLTQIYTRIFYFILSQIHILQLWVAKYIFQNIAVQYLTQEIYIIFVNSNQQANQILLFSLAKNIQDFNINLTSRTVKLQKLTFLKHRSISLMASSAFTFKPNQRTSEELLSFSEKQQSSLKQIDSVYYRLGSSNNYLIEEFSQGNKSLKKDSLGYSNSPSEHQLRDSLQNLTLQQRIFRQNYLLNASQDQLQKPLVSQVQKFILYHQRWIPRPPFSAINTFNPAFHQLEQIKNKFSQKLDKGQLWTQNGQNDLRIDIQYGLYPVPAEQLMQMVSEQGESYYKNSVIKIPKHFVPIYKKYERMNYESSKDQFVQQHIDEIRNFQYEQRNQTLQNFRSQKDKNRLPKPSVIKCASDLKNSQFSDLNKKQADYLSHSNKNTKKSEGKLIFEKQPEQQKSIYKMTYEELSAEVLKRLHILEELNNSQQKYSVLEKQIKNQQHKSIHKNFIDKINQSDQTVNKQEKLLSENNQAESSINDYLKENSNENPLTLSQKRQILQKFNQDQKQMMKKMIQSMLYFREMQGQIRLTQSRNQKDQKSQDFVRKNTQSNKMHQSHNISKQQNQITCNSGMKKQNNSDQTQSLFNCFSYGKRQNKHKKIECNLELKKLEALMRDRQMKQSILDSLGLDSSNNSRSFISIVQRELQ